MILALDTSVPTARVAVVASDGRCLATGEKTAARHSANLLRLVDETLAAAGATLRDVETIVCGAGPGSFTGLRVGLAVAKGLALPRDLPLVLVSSLEALARDLGEPEALVVACLDAGKDQVYGQLFRAGLAQDVAWTIDAHALCARAREAALPIVAGGSGVDRYLDLFRAELGDEAVKAGVAGPSARSVAALGLKRIARGERDDLASAVPVYGRPPDITRPKPR